jgi:hypothetical protein
MNEDRSVKTYVWHEGRCFFVSTIDRDSSSMHSLRFSETIIWEFDWATNKRGALLHAASDADGSIREHLRQVTALHETGEPAHED